MEDTKDKNNIDDTLLDDTIKTIENYLFGKGDNCGEKLFIDFAKTNKKKLIAVPKSSKQPGVQLEIDNFTKGATRQFEFEPLDDGMFRIKSVISGLYWKIKEGFKKDEVIQDEDSDEFKKQMAEYCFRDYAIQIKENNIKRIDIDNTYSFMARHISGNLSGKNNNIIIADVLDEKLLQIITRRLNLSETMIICHKITVEKFYGASVFQITMDSFLKYAEDLKTYCNCPLSLYEYSGYGKVLSFFHAKGKLHLCNPAIEKKELKEKDFFRYSMLLGKTVKINIPEADMENIRQFVNFVQAVRQKGIFFNEMLTFKLLFRFFEKYNIIYSRCIKEAVIEYFKIININISMGMEYLNNDNFMPKDCLQKLPKFQPYESYIQECVLGNNVIELLSKM